MLQLFDAYSGFGGNKPAQRRPVGADEWLAEMSRLSIGRALVRTAPEELDSDYAASNDALFGACENRAALVPCPILIPNTADDAIPEDRQVEAVLAGGAGAACLRPKRDHWTLSEWVCGPLFAALERRKLPAFCREGEFSLAQVAELAGRYPRLPLILAGVGYRSQRVLLPLLETFGNVHVSIGGAFSIHRGLEQLVWKVGPERVLFGSGFPASEPMAAVAQLMYSEVSESQRELIGAGNLSRLVGEVQR